MSLAAPVLSFGNHLHPEEVTPELRERMCRNLSIDHVIWSGFIALITVILVIGTVVVDTVDSVSPSLYWHLGTVIALGLWAELLCYFTYDSRKQFVITSKVTTAVVLRREGITDMSISVPRVQLRYLPKLGEHFDVELLRNAREAYLTWAELDGLSPQFERNLHAGDLLTILYDPNRPSHVRVVEFEH
jgi:hypothetical protein